MLFRSVKSRLFSVVSLESTRGLPLDAADRTAIWTHRKDLVRPSANCIAARIRPTPMFCAARSARINLICLSVETVAVPSRKQAPLDPVNSGRDGGADEVNAMLTHLGHELCGL